jgi:uncharacterized protein (TIGR02145 family)
MAENLNYYVSGSKCGSTLSGTGTLGDENNPTCDTYGRLYTWAMATATTTCPVGWRSPSNSDWNTLMAFVHSDKGRPDYISNTTSSYAGKYLRATSLWNTGSGYMPGTDNYGFSALPGSYGNSANGSFGDGGLDNVKNGGYWWTINSFTASNAYNRHMNYCYENVYSDGNLSKSDLSSIRCIKND